MRVAVIDSGVNAAHPHIISGICAGVTIAESVDATTCADLLGHGTAVMAAIQEKAPEAEYVAVRVFQSALRTEIDHLLRAVEWCIDQRVHIVNLSLGTANLEHASRFAPLIAHAADEGVVLLSSSEANGQPALPGILPGVIAVSLDSDCPRDSYRCHELDGRAVLSASGYPRPAPGIPKERNLNGASFAVANMTGFAARACEGLRNRNCEALMATLVEEAKRLTSES